MNTFKKVADEYASAKNPKWLKLAVRSREIYLDGIRSLSFLNEIPVKQIDRPTVIAIRDGLFDKPGKCRVALTTLSNILSFAYDRGYVKDNPAFQVKDQPKVEPIKRWTQEEINMFILTAPDRLARAVILALYTGQRRSDLVRIKWTDYNGKVIHVVQQKTKKELYIPVHPKLKASLDSMEKDNIYILTAVNGDTLSAPALSNAVKRHCESIGLGHLSIHGLRKSTASTLAEAGCDMYHIQSITGQSLKEVAHYTKEVDQQRLAEKAMEKWA